MSLVDDLRGVLSEDRVLEEPVELYLYSRDSSLMHGEATCVVFPHTTEEVAEVVRVAERHGVPIVARGAGTGLAAGAIPIDGGIVLSTTSMNWVEIDVANRTAWVGAGVINLDLSKEAEPYGLCFAPDPSSQSACTIGGNVANNSGGAHCLAEGATTSHVLGLEVVLAGGEVLVLGGQAPDMPGLDLRGLIVGSEGTLGVVTRALVRLLPIEPDVRTLLLDFDRLSGATKTVSDTIAAGLVPAALEIMDQKMTTAVENWLGAGLPTDAAAVLLAEVVGDPEAVEAEATLITRIGKDNGARHVQVAKDETERAILWKGRKSAFGAVAQVSPNYYLHDTVVPRSRLVETMEEIEEIAARYQLDVYNVFHAGDGNLHPLMAFDASDPEMMERVHRAGEEMVAACLRRGGALSGEHGIGLEKRDMMRADFTELDLDAQARLKEAFDPKEIFNPAKVLPEGSRCFDFGGVRREIPDGAWL
ncbi:MAG TPA: FAD-linked oxidase C-terminal domain-containing protein [Acidimicrobiia bacterium]|nr:FAD-linked oxidase C-terminal domain-containing protein [Acidimicrobiia bacterium]